MAKHNRYQKISTQTQDEALKSAKATQRPGQTKEQTKLIAQGIQKGIDHFKKQHKVKSRELNKKINKATKHDSIDLSDNMQDAMAQGNVINKCIIPWSLLVVSWVGFLLYFYIT